MDFSVPVSRPHIWGDEKLNLCRAVDSGWISSRGPFLDEFEDRFAEKIATRCAVAASSGTAAIHLALSVLDLDNLGDDTCHLGLGQGWFAALTAFVREPVEPSLLEARRPERDRPHRSVHAFGDILDLQAFQTQ